MAIIFGLHKSTSDQTSIFRLAAIMTATAVKTVVETDSEHNTAENVQQKLTEIDYRLKSLEIVLVHAGAEFGYVPYSPDVTRNVLTLKGRNKV